MSQNLAQPGVIMSLANQLLGQLRNPTGWFGRWHLRRMNRHHSRLTDWGLSHISIGNDVAILDIGCGGGRTVQKLAARDERQSLRCRFIGDECGFIPQEQPRLDHDGPRGNSARLGIAIALSRPDI
jgi:hypothetical protein